MHRDGVAGGIRACRPQRKGRGRGKRTAHHRAA
jgi:hypothetical protein